jgi:hypothetical protein
MTQPKAAITGVHGYVPDYILTNAELEEMVDTNDEWIVSRTGIKERHILKGEGKGSSHMGVEAVKGLLAKTNTAPEEVDRELRYSGGLLGFYLCPHGGFSVYRNRQVQKGSDRRSR